jgi:hypothetical protein
VTADFSTLGISNVVITLFPAASGTRMPPTRPAHGNSPPLDDVCG